MMGAITTMTSKGQLTIPKEVRDALNLPAGTKFHVSAVNGRVVAVPKNKTVADLAGFFKSNGRPFPTREEMGDAIGKHLAEDDDRIKRQWNELQAEKGQKR
jgi:antitoxin PrlF